MNEPAPRETTFDEVSPTPDLLSNSASGYTAVPFNEAPLPDVISIHSSGYTAVLLIAAVMLAVAVGVCRYKPRAWRKRDLLICVAAVLLLSYCIVPDSVLHGHVEELSPIQDMAKENALHAEQQTAIDAQNKVDDLVQENLELKRQLKEADMAKTEAAAAEETKKQLVELKQQNSGSLAVRDSLGFIHDTDGSWRVRKRIHRDEVRQSAGEYPAEELKWKAAEAAKNDQWRERDLVGSAKSSFVENEKIRWLNAEFYQSRWEPTFHCAFSERLGPAGDGGKWVCDPGSIGPNCLVYSLGSNNDFRFEIAVHELLPQCEIHTFDHTIDSNPSNKPPYVHFHQWGLAATDEESGQQTNMFTLKQLAAKLEHSDRMIEILKVDIEAAEVVSVDSWADGPIARQILIETHLMVHDQRGWPTPQELDKFMQKLTTKQDYAVVSKEPNIIAARDGGHCCAEYSLLKMAPSFFDHV